MRTPFTRPTLRRILPATLLATLGSTSAFAAPTMPLPLPMGAASQPQAQDDTYVYSEVWAASSAAGNHAQAVDVAKTWVADTVVQFGNNSAESFVPLMRLAGSHEANAQPHDAVRHYADAIKVAERRFGPFAPELIEPLTGLARVQNHLGDSEAAVSALLRAKDITHRNRGIYNPDQTPIGDLLTRMYDKMGNLKDATREQKFLLGTHAKLVGRDSPDFVPALQKWAGWNARINRFSDARRYLYEAIDILEKHYGPNDLRIVETLNMIASTFYDNPSTSYPREGERVLRRAVEVYQAQNFVDQTSLLQARFRLANWHLESGRRKKAIAGYEQAITDALAAGIDTETVNESYALPRLIRTSGLPVPLLKFQQDSVEGEPKLVIIEFDIDPLGRPRNIRTVRNELKLKRPVFRLHDRIAGSIFRPRFVDGNAVSTFGVQRRFEFSKHPWSPIELDMVVPYQDPP